MNEQLDKGRNYTIDAKLWLHNASVNGKSNTKRFKDTILKLNIICSFNRKYCLTKLITSEHALECYCKEYSGSLFIKKQSGSKEHPLDKLYSRITNIKTCWNILPKQTNFENLPFTKT